MPECPIYMQKSKLYTHLLRVILHPPSSQYPPYLPTLALNFAAPGSVPRTQLATLEADLQFPYIVPRKALG